MPIYEYQCGKCEKITEVFQTHFDDPPPTKCPSCGSKKLRKLVSESAFQLKGRGWYKDLYSSVRPSSDGKESSDSKADQKTESVPKKNDAKEKKVPKPKAEPPKKD